ncbi:MAG: hypothetical protein WCW77_05885 [Patescibacteria group bacterium]|jgi:hypothetical protein
MKNSFLIEHKKAPLRKRSVFLAVFTICLFFGAIFQNNIMTVLADGNLWNTVKGGSSGSGGSLLGQVGTDVYGSEDPTYHLEDVIVGVIKVFLSILGLVFLVLLVLGGFKWMMARGDEAKVTEARNQITQAVIGLTIILAAYAITYFVFNTLTNEVMSVTY